MLRVDGYENLGPYNWLCILLDMAKNNNWQRTIFLSICFCLEKGGTYEQLNRKL